jgi:hypothetical protein
MLAILGTGVILGLIYVIKETMEDWDDEQD